MNEQSSNRRTRRSAATIAVDHQLFLVWEKARSQEQKIVDFLSDKFEIKGVTEVVWSPDLAGANFRRLYGRDAGAPMTKLSEIGEGPFLAIVVADPAPIFRFRIPVSGGYRLLNARVFDAKRTLRAIADGGYRIHSTGDPAEFKHDMSLLFGLDYSDRFRLFADDVWDGTIQAYQHDLVGANGWKDFHDLFSIMNRCTEYVVFTNCPAVELWPGVESGRDIDVLCRDAATFTAAANGQRASLRDHQLDCRVKIGGTEVKFDLCEVGDRTFCDEWANRILAHRRLKNGVYVPDRDDAFFMVLYRAALLKRPFPRKYVPALKAAAIELGVEAIAENQDDDVTSRYNWHHSRNRLAYVISHFLIGRNYRFTFPRDPRVRPRLSVIKRLLPSVRPPIVPYLVARPIRKQWGKINAALRARRYARLAVKGKSQSPQRDESGPPAVLLGGRVSSGRGAASPGLARASALYEELLGRPPVPGTLNIVLDEPVELSATRAVLSVDGSQYSWRASLNGSPCLAHRWRACPLHIIEVVSDRRLRADDGIRDGDHVQLALARDLIVSLPLVRLVAWALLWRFRERLFYTSNRYTKLTRNLGLLTRLSWQKVPKV